jgi:hypothetical protein
VSEIATTETEPAATGIDTTGGAAAPPPSSPAPAEHEGADDLDLLADDYDGDDGDDGTDATEADAGADRPAWARPEGLEGDALAQWKSDQGLPTSADDYEVEIDLREGEAITESGQHLINGLKDFAVQNDLPPPAVSGLVKWYDAQVKAQQAARAEADKVQRKSTRDTLTQKWAGAFDQRMTVAKEGARLLPQGLREALKTARTPDGKRVGDLPELAEALLAIGRLTQQGKSVPTSDQDRLAEIENVLRSDVGEYRRQGLDKEHLEILRKRDGNAQARPRGTLTAAEEAEERDLVQQMSTDIDSHRRQWRGTGKSGSDRLLELKRKRAGEIA